MKKLLVCLLLVATITTPVFAQDFPRTEPKIDGCMHEEVVVPEDLPVEDMVVLSLDREYHAYCAVCYCDYCDASWYHVVRIEKHDIHYTRNIRWCGTDECFFSEYVRYGGVEECWDRHDGTNLMK